MDYLNGIWILSIFNVIMALPWSIIFLFTRGTGFRLYHMRNREYCKRIQKKIGEFCTHMIDGKGAGFSVGRWYVVHIQIYGDTYDVWLIATKKTFEELISMTSSEVIMMPSSDNKNKKEEEHATITIFERLGSFTNPFFRQRKIYSNHLFPRDNQQKIINQIVHHFREHRRTVAYIHGSVGTGKSIIGLLMAKELKGIYCSTLKPWQPGDSIGELYSDIDPSMDNPLILIFDEVDIPLRQIHALIRPHREVPIMVMDKSGWNRMLDEIHWGMYPNMILIMTSNQDPALIHKLDPSYLRQGRIDLFFHLS